jgi:hypothetical protein
LVLFRKINGDVVLPAVLESAPRLFSRLGYGSVKACFLTMHARGRRDSHRQNELVLALSGSVSQRNPVPPAARNASRWAQGNLSSFVVFRVQQCYRVVR